jgi:hypothetical protein
MRALMAEECGQHMRIGPCGRPLVTSRNALIDLEPCETTEEDPVWTEAWHGRREWVLRRNTT